jgi:hypothetical protein
MDKLRITTLDMILLGDIAREADEKYRRETRATLEYLDFRGLRQDWEEWIEYQRRKNALTQDASDLSIN